MDFMKLGPGSLGDDGFDAFDSFGLLPPFFIVMLSLFFTLPVG